MLCGSRGRGSSGAVNSCRTWAFFPRVVANPATRSPPFPIGCRYREGAGVSPHLKEEEIPMRKLLAGALLATMTLVGCGGDDGDSQAAGDSGDTDDGLVAACEYIVANQDGVKPTPEEVAKVKDLANDAEFEQSYETLTELENETPDGPSLANFGAFAEQASKVRASCANASVVIPQGETSE